MPRRGENIYKRKDGRWEGRYICGYKIDGTAKYRSVYAHSYKQVKEKLKDAKYIYTNICYSTKTSTSNILSKKISNSTFSEIAINWLTTVKMKNKESTYSKYRTIVNKHLLPIIGFYNIELIENAHIESLLCQKNYLASKTRSDILNVIKLIFSFARKNGYKIRIASDDLYVRVEKTRKIKVLSLEEQNKFTNYLLSDINYKKLGIYIAMYTGIRIGELCALKRNSINFSDSLLLIDSTLQRIQTDDIKSKTKILISSPKSHSSIREIPIPDDIMELLYKHVYELPLDAYILSGNSNYIEPRNLANTFKKYAKECNIEHVTFHTLRHNFASKCVEMNCDVKTLSDILGHSNVNITLNRYVHSSTELKRKNMNKLLEYTSCYSL